MSLDSPEHPSDLTAAARRRFALAAIAGGSVFGTSYFGFLIYWSWQDRSWMLPIIKEHFAAVVGGPCAALASFLIVIVLRYTVGPMEIKAVGFEFRGAAGPIVLWIFCFLAMVSGIKILW